jgi:hypothetical protein
MLLKGGYRICDIWREIPEERKTLVKLGKVDASQSLERHPHQSLLVARIPEMNQERYYELSLNGELYVQYKEFGGSRNALLNACRGSTLLLPTICCPRKVRKIKACSAFAD